MNDEKIIETSRAFWNAMEHANETGMRAIADPNCVFTHIGITCDLDTEIGFYTRKEFQPTGITYHDQKVRQFGDTVIVLTDCDYALLLNGEETSHHFMVTEVYHLNGDSLKLVQFSFTALVY